MLRNIRKKIKWHLYIKKWRKANSQNETIPTCFFSTELVKVGRGTYGGLTVLTHNDTNRLIIGDYCSIAPSVAFIVSSDHSLDTFSTFPHRVKTLHLVPFEATSKGDVIVEDDVWIGYGAIILSGVHIGQGAVIAAGAVVTHDVPPYAIVAGVPAKMIQYRFSPPVIDYMLTLNYSNLTEDLIRAHVDDLYKDISTMTLEDIEKLYGWFPKKAKGQQIMN